MRLKCFLFFSGKENLSSLFAAAEEFTDIINESSKYDELGVGGISNKDRANPKQLQWEMKGNDNFKRRNKTSKGGIKKKNGLKPAKSTQKKGNIGNLKSTKAVSNRKSKVSNKKFKK